MFHSHRRRPRGDDKFYDLLGVPKSASQDELKKAYRKAAIKCHPDKGGDPETFKALSHAYDILSDPEKRSIYDQYGEDALKEGMGAGSSAGMDAADLMSAFFGDDPFSDVFGRGGRRAPRRRQTENVLQSMEATLEEFYNGVTKKLRVTRETLCKKCSGTGSKSGRSMECRQCKGSGQTVHYVSIGLGLMQQLSQVCSACEGKGEVVKEKDKCQGCRGEKVALEAKVLEVHVEKGMKDGEKITFSGLAHEAPNADAGDLIFQVRQKPHRVFKRMGDDLFMEQKLSLVEAICGFTFRVRHLDGRCLLVKSQPGEVIKPGQARAIDNEGMPHHGQPFLRGRLFISFDVVFPDSGSLALSHIDTLRAGIPSPTPFMTEEEVEGCEETTLHDADGEAEMKSKAHERRGRREAYEADEEHEGHGHGVQCPQS